MECQVCKKNEVAMKITRIVDGVPMEYNVCAECAPKISPHHAKLIKKANKQLSKTDVENLLKDLLQKSTDTSAGPIPGEAVDAPVCSECGLDYRQFQRTFMLGCEQCYDSFGDRLLKDIEKIQSATQHVADAETPRAASTVDTRARLVVLRHELDDAIEDEDFARAAIIRDEIKELQSVNSKSGTES